MTIIIGDMPLSGNEASREEIDRRRAERIARARARQPQRANGKQRAQPAAGGSAPPPAKKPRPPAGTGAVASVALVRRAEDGREHVLLTRETRSGKTLLNLPGGKAHAGETPGQAAAREAHEETGGQLTEGARAAIATIADWAECTANQGRVGVLRLAAGSPDATVHERFDGTAANANRGSTTVRVGLEWHPLSDARSHAWRAEHMHFAGQHRLAAAARLAGSPGSGAPSALHLGNAAEAEAPEAAEA